MNFDCVRQFRQLLAQTQTDLFRCRTDIGENNDRLTQTNQLRQFGVETRAGISRRRVRIASDWRKNVHYLFLLDARFGDAATAVFANKKLRQQIERRGRRGKTDATEIVVAAKHLQSLEGNAQIGAAFVAGEGMQFIDDYEFSVDEMLRVTL